VLPPEVGQLANLLRLELPRNQLTVLPAELGQLTNLQRLDLAGNPLAEPLPGLAAQGAEAVLAYLQSLAAPAIPPRPALVANECAGRLLSADPPR